MHHIAPVRSSRRATATFTVEPVVRADRTTTPWAAARWLTRGLVLGLAASARGSAAAPSPAPSGGAVPCRAPALSPVGCKGVGPDLWGPVDFGRLCDQRLACTTTLGADLTACNRVLTEGGTAVCRETLVAYVGYQGDELPGEFPSPDPDTQLGKALTTCDAIAERYKAAFGSAATAQAFNEAQQQAKAYEDCQGNRAAPPPKPVPLVGQRTIEVGTLPPFPYEALQEARALYSSPRAP